MANTERIIKMQALLRVLFGEYIFVNTREEDAILFPEQAEDWAPGEYLIIADREEYQLLGGAYTLDWSSIGVPILVWLPYPSDPVKGLASIMHCLHEHIENYKAHIDK